MNTSIEFVIACFARASINARKEEQNKVADALALIVDFCETDSTELFDSEWSCKAWDILFNQKLQKNIMNEDLLTWIQRILTIGMFQNSFMGTMVKPIRLEYLEKKLANEYLAQAVKSLRNVPNNRLFDIVDRNLVERRYFYNYTSDYILRNLDIAC